MTKRKQKGRNLTVYIADSTAAKMSELSEVNWSQICKAAIESYVDARKSASPAARLKYEKSKGAEEKAGYIYGSQLAEEIVDKLSYQQVHDLRWKILDEEAADWWNDSPNRLTDWLNGTIHGQLYATNEERKKWQKEFDEWASEEGSLGWMLKLAEKKKGFRKNPRFFDGMVKALREILA